MKKKKKNCYVSHADSVVLYPVLFKIQECPVPPVFRNLNLSLHLFIDRLKKDFYILLCFKAVSIQIKKQSRYLEQLLKRYFIEHDFYFTPIYF